MSLPPIARMDRAGRGPVIATVALSTLVGPVAHAGALRVVVLDARSRTPLPGAFVQVGPAPGSPFAGNSGATASDGSIAFADPALVGPQTVTKQRAPGNRLQPPHRRQIWQIFPR